MKIQIGILALAGLLASGCGVVSGATRGVTSAAGSLLMTNAEERKLGLQLAAEVKQKEKVHANAEVQAYVSSIANKVLAAVPSKEKPFPYTFTVLDSDTVNAFAIPGGQVFIYSGLIKAAATESELAGVIGHEIAHVTKGHSRDQLTAQYGMQMISDILLGKNQGALTGMATNIAKQGYMSAYSRDCETESDMVGLGYMSKAGFAPAGMASFFTTLQKLGGSSNNAIDAFFASHPDSGERSKALVKKAAEDKLPKGSDNPIGKLAAIKKLL